MIADELQKLRDRIAAVRALAENLGNIKLGALHELSKPMAESARQVHDMLRADGVEVSLPLDVPIRLRDRYCNVNVCDSIQAAADALVTARSLAQRIAEGRSVKG